MLARWLTSPTARQVIETRRRILNNYRAQRDVLTSEQREKILTALADLDFALTTGLPESSLMDRFSALQAAAKEVFPKAQHHSARDNVEVVLVALMIAMAVWTFLLQPFKIPTASMQPTLYGENWVNLRNRTNNAVVPTGVDRFWREFGLGETYYAIQAAADGVVESIEPPDLFLGLVPRQRFRIGSTTQTIWFPPEGIIFPIRRGQVVRKGDELVRLKVTSGDHLFVDRLSFNFRKPRRGDIVVFETHGIERMPRDQWGQYFIKRLVGLPGETLSIGNDRHLRVNGQRLDASTPHFENVYSFKVRWQEGEYAGHLNGSHLRDIAPLFRNERATFTVRPGHYMVFGDNSVSSFDSRTWGDLPKQNLIGRSFFIYWPYSARFGFGQR